MGSQRVRHNWATELNWTEPSCSIRKYCRIFYSFTTLFLAQTPQAGRPELSLLVKLHVRNSTYCFLLTDHSSATHVETEDSSSIETSKYKELRFLKFILLKYRAFQVAQWKRICLPSGRWFDPWVRKIPWRRKWQPTPISHLGDPMDGADWQATVHVVAKSQTQLSD